MRRDLVDAIGQRFDRDLPDAQAVARVAVGLIRLDKAGTDQHAVGKHVDLGIGFRDSDDRRLTQAGRVVARHARIAGGGQGRNTGIRCGAIDRYHQFLRLDTHVPRRVRRLGTQQVRSLGQGQYDDIAACRGKGTGDDIVAVFDDHFGPGIGRDGEGHIVNAERDVIQVRTARVVDVQQVHRGTLRSTGVNVMSSGPPISTQIAREVLDDGRNLVVAVGQRFDRDLPESQAIARGAVRLIRLDKACPDQDAAGEYVDRRIGFGDADKCRLLQIGDIVAGNTRLAGCGQRGGAASGAVRSIVTTSSSDSGSSTLSAMSVASTLSRCVPSARINVRIFTPVDVNGPSIIVLPTLITTSYRCPK